MDSFNWKKPIYSSSVSYSQNCHFTWTLSHPSHHFYVLSTKSDRNSDTHLHTQLTERTFSCTFFYLGCLQKKTASQQNISENTLGSDDQLGITVHLKPPFFSKTTAHLMSKPGHLKKTWNVCPRSDPDLTSELLAVLLVNVAQCGLWSCCGSLQGRRTLNINNLIDTWNWVMSLTSPQKPTGCQMFGFLLNILKK